MDDLYLDLITYPRTFRGAAPITTFGVLSRKTDWMDRAGITMNFSIILRGRGWATIGSHPRIEVLAPCVLIQPPHTHCFYGPKGSWSEVYCTFEGRWQQHFEEQGLLKPDRISWPIHNLTRVQRTIDQTLGYLESIEHPGIIDLVDRSVDALITSTLLPQLPVPESRNHTLLLEAEEYIRKHCAEDLDFHALASSKGLSYANFRKLWSRNHQDPPTRYLIKTRMNLACRLLAESPDTVAEIGARVGYADPLYFSRVFKRTMACSPTEYRQTRTAFQPEPERRDHSPG